jgi:hypothetical protein
VSVTIFVASLIFGGGYCCRSVLAELRSIDLITDFNILPIDLITDYNHKKRWGITPVISVSRPFHTDP